MPRGISLHIGVNRVDDQHYRKTIFAGDGWAGELKGCEFDARAMEAIAKAQGFRPNILLTKEATRANVKNQILSAAEHLEAGDYFFLTYSGHGSQVLDLSGDEAADQDSPGEKGDRLDETWCLYDAQLLDDELHELWSQFKQGVRVLLFSDSCHSGTVGRGEDELPKAPEGMAYRFIPKASLTATYKVHKDFYDGFQSKKDQRPKIAARVLLFSGCQDYELSVEDQSNDQAGGLFTKRLTDLWTFEKFDSYKAFFEKLKIEMYDDLQTPNYCVFGGDDPAFENSPPLDLSP